MSEIIADAAGAILSAGMVGSAAWFDLRERGIPYGMLAVIGIAAAVFMAVRWIALGMWPSGHDIVWMAIACAVSLTMLFRGTLVARGDALMIMITGTLVPSIVGIPALPMAMGIALGVAIVAHIAGTIVPNLAELARTGRVFAGVDESAIRKAAAFLVVHRRRSGERFCFAAEATSGGRRRLVLLPGSLDDADIGAQTVYVISAIPFMVPYLVGAIAVAALAIVAI